MSEVGVYTSIQANLPEKTDSHSNNFIIDPELNQLEAETLRSVYESALKVIGRFLPEDAVPVEPTVVTFDDSGFNRSGYFGKLNGKHYVRVCNPDGNWTINRRSQLKMVYMMAHELLHQRTAEVVGPQAFQGGNFDEMYSLIPKADQPSSVTDVIQFLTSSQTTTSELNVMLAEGIAIFRRTNYLFGVDQRSNKLRRQGCVASIPGRVENADGRYETAICS